MRRRQLLPLLLHVLVRPDVLAAAVPAAITAAGNRLRPLREGHLLVH